MAKTKRDKASPKDAGGKPKHSNDANRGTKTGMRDAATVRSNSDPPPRSQGHLLSCHVPRTTRETYVLPFLQVRRLNMYKTRPKRDKNGKLIYQVRPPVAISALPGVVLVTIASCC